MPLLFKFTASSSAMETIEDLDPRNRASVRMLTKIGLGELLLRLVMISVNLVT